MPSSLPALGALLGTLLGENEVCAHQDTLNKVSAVLAVLIMRTGENFIEVHWDEIKATMGKNLGLEPNIAEGTLRLVLHDASPAKVSQPTHQAPTTKQ